MSENPDTRKLSVTFERKLDVGNYQNVVARAWLESNVDADADEAVVSAALSNAFGLCKAAVYDELGIEVTMDDAGVIREKNIPTATVTEQRLGKELGATPVTGGGSFDTKGLNVVNEDDMTQDIPGWLVAIYEANDLAGVWANNGKYGQFYKEYVPKDGTPKLGVDEKGRTKIISKPK